MASKAKNTDNTGKKKGQNGQQKASVKRKELELDERMILVQQMYLSGKSFRVIAKKLGVSHQTIANDVQKILKAYREIYADKIYNWAMTQMARYDELIDGLWTSAKNGNLDALDGILKIMDKQNVLLGGQPVMRVDITSDGKALGAGDETKPLEAGTHYMDVMAVIKQAQEQRENGSPTVLIQSGD